ncbi:hypothetical protein B0H13DRAFT_2336181 [Mycena leptocephala]|nr:hypothetical protein B0H13DRAFT_2336181 [Mycena leptocephala]
MLHSHRILCSCVPASLFRISPPRYTFALPFAPPPLAFPPVWLYPFTRMPARCISTRSFLRACSPQFRRSLFRPCARSPHFCPPFPMCLLAPIPPLAVSHTPAHISSARSLFPAHLLAATPPLAVYCTPAHISAVRSLFPAHLLAATPLLAVYRMPARISAVRSLFPAPNVIKQVIGRVGYGYGARGTADKEE